MEILFCLVGGLLVCAGILLGRDTPLFVVVKPDQEGDMEVRDNSGTETQLAEDEEPKFQIGFHL